MPKDEVYDPYDMRHQTAHMVKDLEASLKQDLHINPVEFDKILICGMGGSAIGGDIVADALYSVSDIPVSVVRFSNIPESSDDKTLVFISSYSGNTMEVLDAYEHAKQRKCKIIAITSGGDLHNRCMQDNTPLISVKEGIQPRNAVGYTVGYLINAIATVGGPDIRNVCLNAIPSLKKYLDEVLPLEGLPRKIALEIYGKLPVIYSSPELYSIAGRWRAQFNENAKIVAFDGHLPDTNHNDIFGLLTDGNPKVKPIILVERNQPKMIRKLTNSTVSALKAQGLDPYVVNITGKTAFERSLKAMLLGDFISLQLAFFQSIDPSDVSAIKNLKKSLMRKLLGKRSR